MDYLENRGFSSKLGNAEIAKTVPSSGLLILREEALSEDTEATVYEMFGKFEEVWHMFGSKTSLIRNMHFFENVNRMRFFEYLKGETSLEQAKHDIVRNELVCEKIYHEIEDFIETVDQWKVLQIMNEASENSKSSHLAQKLLEERGTPENQVYDSLENLREIFNSWHIAWYAAYFTINIPYLIRPIFSYLEELSKPQDNDKNLKKIDPNQIHDVVIEPIQIDDVDTMHRFDAINSALKSHEDEIQALVTKLNITETSDVIKIQKFLRNILEQEGIRVAQDRIMTNGLPLLDSPANIPPDAKDKIIDIKTSEDFFKKYILLQNNSNLSEDFTFKFVMDMWFQYFHFYGGVMLDGVNETTIFPNDLVKHFRTHKGIFQKFEPFNKMSYVNDWYVFILAQEIIGQLIDIGEKEACSVISCPFCDTITYPYNRNTCLFGNLISQLNADDISRKFAEISVPGEEELAKYRSKH